MSENSNNISKEKTLLKAANQELKALNQQLTATEQQLRAANEQLKADDQQLRAANQQLKAEEQQLRQGKAELRRQHNILRTLIDNLPDIIYVKDIDSRFVVANVAAAKHMGAATTQSLVAKTDHDFYPEGLASKYYVDEQTAIKTDTPRIDREEPNIDEKGNTLWFSSSKIPLKDDDGKIIGIVGISRDITERKKFEQDLLSANQKLIASEQQLKAANQQLRASEQQLKAANQQLKANEIVLSNSEKQYKTMFESSINALVVYEAVNDGNDFIIKNFNPSAEKIEKIKRNDLIGKSITETFPGIKEFGILDILRKVWKTGKPEHIPVSLYNDQRISGWRENYIFKLPSGEIVASYRDVTKRKIAEESLKRALGEMEQRVKERTADLEKANEKLSLEVSERKKVEEKIMDYQLKLRSMTAQLLLAEERQRKQIAEKLHDDAIQTLVFLKMKINDLQELSSSKGFAQILDQLDEQTAELIQRMRTLTFDLGSPILYDLGLAAAIKDWLTREIGEKHGIETSFENDQAPKPMDDDLKTLLYRSVRELLANVVKHAKAKKIKVSKTKDKNNVIITVKDDGIGFNVAKKELKYDVATGGFGLFTINERLGQYNGTLNIESMHGKGTKITLTAPLKSQN